MDEVVLVTEKDEPVGTMSKMRVHELGLLHRAFSVFIFNRSGEMLLQQRAMNKYHGGGLWTNACCSHPRPGEDVALAASRRLQEELGFQTQLEPLFTFTYRAEVENGLIEFEYDHVYFGCFDGNISPNQEEVMDVRIATMSVIAYELKYYPEKFTAWFRIAFDRVYEWWKLNSNQFKPNN